jgi:cytochrome c
MNRRPFSVALGVVLLFCATVLLARSYTPKTNTREAVKAYVDRAAKQVARHGPSCAEFKEKNWASGDYYVFVIGPDNHLVCHPNASMVGKMNTEIVDANGKKVGEELAEAANGKEGHGWVDYVWPRPGQTKPVPKSSYAEKVKGPDGKWYVVGAGGYELK